MNPLGITLNSIPSQAAQPGWLDWLQNLRNGPPLQPVDGVPISPAYRQMPNATAPIVDTRGAGPSSWASRPHDQDLQSRNLGGYVSSSAQFGGPAYQWQKTHGFTGNLPTTPLADAGFIPTDPSIMARIRAAQGAATSSDDLGWGG